VIALDFGTGALSALRASLDYSKLDAIVISHMHADHFLDLIPLRYALKYGPSRIERRLPVYVPPSGVSMLTRLVSAFETEGRPEFFDPVMEPAAYDPGSQLVVGDVKITFARTLHPIETYAMRVESAGTVVVYSADTAPCDAVVELARDADLFVCEATLGTDGVDVRPRMHATAREAADMAKRARVKHLVLSHYGSECDPQAMHAAATAVFAERITIADDGVTLPA
jgi:ribonuclease BN (tRNA processing enzyme)